MAVKWRDKDRKVLFERVRDKFLQLFRLRVNVLRVDPMVKIKKKQEILAKKNEKEMRRIEKKRREKHQKKLAVMIAKKISSGNRSGLRSRSQVMNSGDLPHDVDLNASALADLSSSLHPNGCDANMTAQENPELS